MVASWYKGNDVKGFFAQANGHQVTRELLPASVCAPLHSFFFPFPCRPFHHAASNSDEFDQVFRNESHRAKGNEKERKEKLGE